MECNSEGMWELSSTQELVWTFTEQNQHEFDTLIEQVLQCNILTLKSYAVIICGRMYRISPGIMDELIRLGQGVVATREYNKWFQQTVVYNKEISNTNQ
jgi:hypothetical protein